MSAKQLAAPLPHKSGKVALASRRLPIEREEFCEHVKLALNAVVVVSGLVGRGPVFVPFVRSSCVPTPAPLTPP
jgi:hypothetical protein